MHRNYSLFHFSAMLRLSAVVAALGLFCAGHPRPACAADEMTPPPVGEAQATSDDEAAAVAEESSASPAPSAAAPSTKRARHARKAPRSRPTAASSDDLELRSDAPLRYVVKKGDTLWDISGHFLQKPWLWPELWYNNPDIKNPHLIYPGEVLYLVWVNGRPRLSRTPPSASEKLEPQIRELPLSDAIPTIPIDAIRAFLLGPRVVGAKELEAAPYVLDFVGGEHLMAGAGQQVYVRNVDSDKNGSDYSIVRKGQTYRDPDDNDALLGYEAIYVGKGTVTKQDKPATVNIDESTREVLRGDRLFPATDSEFTANFYPHAPKKALTGRIISVYDGVSQIGTYQIVTLNKGYKQGLEVGHVLSIWQASREVNDTVSGGRVQLPDERAGLLMVFKVYERISYALVMKASLPIHVMDKVKSPDAES